MDTQTERGRCITVLTSANGTPMTKTLVFDDGEYTKLGAPNAYKLNSGEIPIPDPQTLYKVLCAVSRKHGCVQKGRLDKVLRDEPRAGHTLIDEPTDWLVFDVDNGSFDSPEDFISSILPPAFHDVSYVLHYSSSYGAIPSAKKSFHLFFLLDEPVDVKDVKRWMLKLNYDRMPDDLELSAHGIGLRYGLDPSVAGNDKLIYVSDPICVGFEDPMAGKRFELVEKEQDEVSYTFEEINDAALQEMRDHHVARQRKLAGLPEKKPSYYPKDGCARNPDRAKLKVVDRSNGYVHLNLGEGDSKGYYHPENDPTIIFNFKGEAPFRTKDVDPEYLNGYQKERLKAAPPGEYRPFTFRDVESGYYFAGLWCQATNTLRQFGRVRARLDIKDFFEQHGEVMPPVIETWEMRFDPSTLRTVNIDDGMFNTWHPTAFQKEPPMSYGPDAFPWTRKVILHALGGDEQAYAHFINWMAVVVKHRVKTGTAWVLHGNPGIGKGRIFEDILKPLLGPEFCFQYSNDAFADKFNAKLATTLLLNYDEAEVVGHPGEVSKLAAKLKGWITEEQIALRGMGTDWTNVPSYMNVLIFSNTMQPIKVDMMDRRFSVAPRQEVPLNTLWAGDKDFNIREVLAEEREAFAGYLLQEHPADIALAATVYESEAKKALVALSTNTTEEFAHAIASRNLEYFVEGVADTPTSYRHIEYGDVEEAKNAVERWRKEAQAGETSAVRSRDLFTLYRMLVTHKDVSATAFVKIMQHRGLTVNDRTLAYKDPASGTDKRSKGTHVHWKPLGGLSVISAEQPKAEASVTPMVKPVVKPKRTSNIEDFELPPHLKNKKGPGSKEWTGK